MTSYPNRSLYDPDILRTIFIQFDTDSWEEEMAAFKNTDVEMPATVIVDGKTYPLVGLKFRGQSSFFMIPAGSKRSLNLSMDFINENQRLYGYRTLNLLNCNGDSSMMSSALYSFVAQDLLPVPKANFVKVVINGESWGVYANLQQFNKDFLRDHYKTTAGVRWKVPGNPGADGGLRYLGEDLEEYKQRFEIKSKDKERSWRALINLCEVLNETPTDDLPAAIEPILDVDGLLCFLAIDVALVNSDGYWTRASDYNLYLDPTGVFHVIPHDMNEAFVTGRGMGGHSVEALAEVMVPQGLARRLASTGLVLVLIMNDLVDSNHGVKPTERAGAANGVAVFQVVAVDLAVDPATVMRPSIPWSASTASECRYAARSWPYRPTARSTCNMSGQSQKRNSILKRSGPSFRDIGICCSMK